MTMINWLDDTTRRYLTGAVARPEPGDPRRRCFYVDDEHTDEPGYIPMLVIEDVAGYRPMLGANPPASTWYWGRDLDEALRFCDLVNTELFSLTREQAHEIVDSSIRAQLTEDDKRGQLPSSELR